MPFSTTPVGHVRIMRCEHGTNYVTLGPVTLRLTDPELVLLDRAIHKLALRQADLRRALFDGSDLDPTDGPAASGDLPEFGGPFAAGQP